MKKPRSHSRHLQVSGLMVIAALSLAQVTRAVDPVRSPPSARKARTSSGCRRRRRWWTRCSTWPRSRRSDFLMDLGSGDGRTVITAAKRGARALGIEYNPDMVELAKRNAEKEGVAGKATFVKADLFETDFSKATVITLFLLPDINLRLRPKILD